MKEKIKQVAILHFNKLGYEGVKMAHIATEVGIKKQSLSYYYPSKKKLVMELYTEVITEEIAYIKNFFQQHKELPAKEQLYTFLQELMVRFQQQPNEVFLQITAYLVPFELQNFIKSEYHKYLHVLKQEILSTFSPLQTNCSKVECTIAYLTIFDGLLTKLIYEPSQSFEEVLDATFSIFWRGIS